MLRLASPKIETVEINSYYFYLYSKNHTTVINLFIFALYYNSKEHSSPEYMLGFNDKLIKAIEELIPRKKDQQAFLQNILPLGKETIYRRLRGEIFFTFSEACIIANKLKISLDTLVQVENQNTPLFSLGLSTSKNPVDTVKLKLQQHEDSYTQFLEDPGLTIKSVFSFVPYSLLFPFDGLFKFKMFQYLYQLDTKNVPDRYSAFDLPEELNLCRQDLSEKNPFMPKDMTIIDRKIFIYMVEEINFFHSLGILTEEEKKYLREEMLQLIHYFEYITSYGVREASDMESLIYLSNVNVYYSYTLVRGNDFVCSYMDGIYSLNTILSTDVIICKMHEEWIESLKRFSTLISVSGEIDRRSFFSLQKKQIEDLLS